MPTDQAKRLLQLRDDMVVDRSTFDNLYEDVSRFIFPQRARINSKTSQGEDRTLEIYDSTATNSAFIAASATQGSIVPSTIKWFNMRLSIREMEQLEGVKEWLHSLTIATLDAINGSNFQTEIQEVFLDLYGYGTGCVFVGQRSVNVARTTGFRGLHFKSTQPGYYCISENEDGLVDRIFRDFRLSSGAIVSMFGEERLPRKVRECLDKDRPTEMHDITHYVGPREGIDPLNVDPDAPVNKMPWESAFILLGEGEMLGESGFFQFPYMVPRWSKMSGELFGRGPGINCLPDVRTLNRAVELKFGAVEKAIDPPMGVLHRGVMGNIDIRARGKTILRSKDAVFPLHQHPNFQAAQMNEMELKDSIRRAFFIDQIQLPPMGHTPATATEIAGRFETMQRILGPTFGRIQFELFNPMLGVVASTLIREGVVPPPPEELMDALEEEGLSLEFEYEGPLTRAQQFQDVENIQRAATILASLAELFPGITRYFDDEEAGKAILASSSVPPAIVRTEEEVQAMREAAEQAQQQQAMSMGALNASQAIKNVAPILQEGGLDPAL